MPKAGKETTLSKEAPACGERLPVRLVPEAGTAGMSEGRLLSSHIFGVGEGFSIDTLSSSSWPASTCVEELSNLAWIPRLLLSRVHRRPSKPHKARK